MKEMVNAPWDVTFCTSNDRRGVLEICDENRTARRMMGPMLLDKLSRQLLVQIGKKCHTVYVSAGYLDVFAVGFAEEGEMMHQLRCGCNAFESVNGEIENKKR